MLIWLLLIFLILSLVFNLILIFKILYKKTKLEKLKNNKDDLNKKLEELRFFNQKILDNVPVSIAVADKDGNVLLTNHFFRKIVPWYDPDKGLNLLKSKRLNKAGLAEKYANVLASGITFSQKGVLINSPKPYYSFYINLEVIPLKDEQGEIIGAISIGQEITSLMKAKDNLTKINEKLDLEVKKRTKEFYEINNQLADKITFYEKIFDFLAQQLRQNWKKLLTNNEPNINGTFEQFKNQEVLNIFKDFIFLNQIEKKELKLNLQRIRLSHFLEKIFGKEDYRLVIENLVGDKEILIDIAKMEYVFKGLYDRFDKYIEQGKIKADKKANQVSINLDFVIKQINNFKDEENNFFWDIQLFMYKEIVDLHKGILTEKIVDNKIEFEIKFILFDNY
jgi:hypothetical protein